MSDEQNIIIYRTADGRASVALYAMEDIERSIKEQN